MTKPRIYVACLAANNSGELHGAWIDATRDEWSIETDIQTMLAASPIAGAEEWAVHDYEGFEGARVDEYASVQTVARLARFVADHGKKGAAVLDYYGGDIDEAEEALSDRYMGCYATAADYVENVMAECIAIPEPLRFYIDWRAIARDAEMSGEIFTIQITYDETHVFAAN